MKRFLSMYRVEQKIFFRSPDVILFCLAMPLVVFVVITMITGGKNVADSGLTYLQSSYVSLSTVGICCSAFMSIPNTVVELRSQGILRRMYCSPCSPARLLTCDTICSGVIAALSTLILTVAAVAVFGYRMPEMGALMEQSGCECALPEYCFTNYPEPGYKESDIPVEICEAVAEAKTEVGDLKFKNLPQIQAACVFHKGSYRTFSESYETVLRYIEENGYEIAGEIRESYIDGIWNKDDENQWLSEIQVPVRKKQNSISHNEESEAVL